LPHKSVTAQHLICGEFCRFPENLNNFYGIDNSDNIFSDFHSVESNNIINKNIDIDYEENFNDNKIEEKLDILKIKNERNYLNLFTFDFGMNSNNLNDILLSEDKKIEEKTENNMDIESNPEIVRNKNKSKKNKNRKNKNKKCIK